MRDRDALDICLPLTDNLERERLAREYLLSVLGQGVEVGALEIIEGDSKIVLGKIQDIKRPARIVVNSDAVWWRIFTYVSISLSPCI